MKRVAEPEFDVFYKKHNKLNLSRLEFEDVWNKSNSVIVRKIIRTEDKKVIAFIVNWTKFYICI